MPQTLYAGGHTVADAFVAPEHLNHTQTPVLIAMMKLHLADEICTVRGAKKEHTWLMPVQTDLRRELRQVAHLKSWKILALTSKQHAHDLPQYLEACSSTTKLLVVSLGLHHAIISDLHSLMELAERTR